MTYVAVVALAEPADTPILAFFLLNELLPLTIIGTEVILIGNASASWLTPQDRS